jgi:hypothetical protein
MLKAAIESEAAAAYHRELARANDAWALHIVTQIWPADRRGELTAYLHPASTTDGLGPSPASDSPDGAPSGETATE